MGPSIVFRFWVLGHRRSCSPEAAVRGWLMQKSRCRARLCIFVATCCSLVGCAVQVGQSDLVGSWQMTDESLRLLHPKLLNGQRPGVDLRADGTFLAEHLPVSGFSDAHLWQRLYSGSGKWGVPPVKITEGFSAATFQFDTTPDEGAPTGVTLLVGKDSGSFTLFVWLDEEGGESLRYKRVPEK